MSRNGDKTKIFSKEDSICPVCGGPLKVHGTCTRKVRHGDHTRQYHLRVIPYDFSQTKAYIEKQLAYAGHPNAIFSEDAMKAVHSFSSGIPRLINRACTQSLVYAYQNRRAIIDDRMVQLVLEGEVS